MSRLNVNQIYTRDGTTSLSIQDIPAFSVFLSADQNISQSTYTKVQCDSVILDTNSWYSTSTYTYTPQIAGWYWFQSHVRVTGTSQSIGIAVIAKNGGHVGNYGLQRESGPAYCFSSSLVYMNGSTDYVESQGQSNGTNPLFDYSSDVLTCTFQGFLVRPD